MINDSIRIPPKKRISQSFGLKAPKYEKYAEVQQKFQLLLIERVLQESPDGIFADLGCGTGFFFSKLRESGWNTPCIGIDLSVPSIRYLKDRTGGSVDVVIADIEQLPFKNNVFKSISFSSVLQWITDIETFFMSIYRVMQPEGKIFFSIFTTGSFIELSTVRALAKLSNPISLPGIDQVSDALKRSGFKKISLFEHEEILYFPTARELLKSLSAIGSTAVSEKPMTRNQLHNFCSLMESTCKTDNGVPFTYKAAVGWAQKETI